MPLNFQYSTSNSSCIKAESEELNNKNNILLLNNKKRIPLNQTPTDLLPYEDIIKIKYDEKGNYEIILLDDKLIDYRKEIELNSESRADRLTRYVNEFSLSSSKLSSLYFAFQDELTRGLNENFVHPDIWNPEKCSFKMLDSCLPRLPTGTETGVFYALDFGGTNFRVVRVCMSGTSITTSQHKYSLLSAAPYPKGLLDAQATATEMFDFFASCLKSRMIYYGDVPSQHNFTDNKFRHDEIMNNNDNNKIFNKNQITEPRARSSSWFAPTPEDSTCFNNNSEDENNINEQIIGCGLGSPVDTNMNVDCDDRNEDCELSPHLYPVGFTFSFPCFQRSLTSAVLVEWTKDFMTGRNSQTDFVEGRDVGQLLTDAFLRQNVNAVLAAVVNDTVGTLVSGAFEAASHSSIPPVRIGLIVGTGINACYVDPASVEYRYTGKVINIECGNYDRELPLTSIDFELDFVDRTNRSKQLLEKMISGAYMGEICRRTIVRVLQNESTEEMWKTYSLSTAKAAAIAQDVSSDYSTTLKTISEVWNVCLKDNQTGNAIGKTSIDKDILPIIQKICWVVMDRAAALAAVIVSATSRRCLSCPSASGGVTVAIDGSLYKCVSLFRKRMRHYIELMMGTEMASLVNCVVSDDGSGKGAALIAALVCT